MTPRDRRALVFGGSTIAAAVVLLRVVPWCVRGVRLLRDEALERSATAIRARDVLASKASLRDSLGVLLNGIVNLSSQLVDGHSSSEAQATLSGIVSLAAENHSLKVTRLDPIADSAAGVLSRVAVHAELEGDVNGFARLLQTIETGQPLLTVTSFSVSAPDPSAQVEGLHIDVDVRGYYLPRGEP